MGIKERNKKVALKRWSKLREKEAEYIKSQQDQNHHLKARILGYISGDGSISTQGKRNDIRFYPDHESLITSFSEAMEVYYNKTVKVKKLKNFYLVRVFSRTVSNDLLQNGKLNTYLWKIPTFDNDLDKIEWLRAFFDCEAYVGKKRISIGCVNESGLMQIKEILEEFGISSRFYSYTPKNKKWNKTFILIISSNKDRLRYFNKIGFNHSLKREKLKTYLDTPTTDAAVA